MNCPHCDKDIPDHLTAAHFASIGGRKSKRKITPEQQRVMQAKRKESSKAKKGSTNGKA